MVAIGIFSMAGFAIEGKTLATAGIHSNDLRKFLLNMNTILSQINQTRNFF